MGVSVQINKLDQMSGNIEKYLFFLSDEFSAHDFLKKNNDGPRIETPFVKNGFNLYNVKISQEKHLGILWC